MCRMLFLSTCILLSACAGPGSQTRDPAAQSWSAATDSQGLVNLDQARKIVADFMAAYPTTPPDDPLRNPKSLDDVLEILKRDQLALFEAGVAFVRERQDPEADALHAQLELAWGESNAVLADLLWENAARLRPVRRRLEFQKASGTFSEEDAKKLDSVRKTIAEETTVATALMRLAAEHFAAGSVLARKIIDERPSDYVGYRIAADYYRLGQDWEQFDAMVSKLEAINPQSNGLAFLRGVAAADRQRDVLKAAEYLDAALARDPAFTRAQAHRVLWADTVEEQHRQLQKLKKLNPNHPIVVWAGERIQQAAGQ